MKLPTDENWIVAGVICVVLTVCAGGWATRVHAQPPEVPVQDIEEVGTLRKLLLTLQMVMVPAAREQISPLYAYHPAASEINGLEVRPETLGSVATVSRCGDAPEEEAGWCARYFDHMGGGEALLAAYQAAHRATVVNRPNDAEGFAASNQAGASPQPPTYFATTYPLPNVEPARRFVSGLSP